MYIPAIRVGDVHEVHNIIQGQNEEYSLSSSVY